MRNDRKRGGVIGSERMGIVVACDLPPERIPDLFEKRIQPIHLVFEWQGHDPFHLPIREPEAIEIIAVVNNAWKEGKIEFGFRPKGPGGPQVVT
jgi:hypothetical protein